MTNIMSHVLKHTTSISVRSDLCPLSQLLSDNRNCVLLSRTLSLLEEAGIQPLVDVSYIQSQFRMSLKDHDMPRVAADSVEDSQATKPQFIFLSDSVSRCLLGTIFLPNNRH